MPFTGNIIPTARLDKYALALLQYYPAANVPGAGLSNNFEEQDTNTWAKWQITERVDFVQNAKSDWFARYTMQDESQVQPALDLNGQNLIVRAKQTAIGNTFIISPTIVNQARVGFLNFYNSYGPQLAGITNVNAQIGLPGLLSSPSSVAWGVPTVGLANGFSGFGNSTDGPYNTSDHILQVGDDISWTRGKHSFKFGAQVERVDFNENGNQYARGNYQFSNLATSGPLASEVGYGPADYLLGYINNTTDAVALAVSRFMQTNQYYFAQDTWKIRPNITISYGVRYEFAPFWSDRAPLVNVWFPQGPAWQGNPTGGTPAPVDTAPCIIENGIGTFNAGNVVFPTLAQGTATDPGVCQARDGRLGPNLGQSDKRDFAPRFGVAWSPTSNWTVRVGAGVFYTQDTGNPVFDMSRSLAGKEVVFETGNNLTFENPLATSPTNLCGVSAPQVCVPQPTLVSTYYDRQTPYVEEYEMNIQRQLGQQHGPRSWIPGNARPSPAALYLL